MLINLRACLVILQQTSTCLLCAVLHTVGTACTGKPSAWKVTPTWIRSVTGSCANASGLVGDCDSSRNTTLAQCVLAAVWGHPLSDSPTRHHDAQPRGDSIRTAMPGMKPDLLSNLHLSPGEALTTNETAKRRWKQKAARCSMPHAAPWAQGGSMWICTPIGNGPEPFGPSQPTRRSLVLYGVTERSAVPRAACSTPISW